LRRTFALLMLAMAAPAFADDPPAAGPADLGVYADKYPTDPVEGVSFLAHPRVRAAAEAAGVNDIVRRWVFEREGQRTPIALRDGWLVSWGCEAHNCNDHEWTIYIDRAGNSVRICYHVARTMGTRSRWFQTGHPSQLRPDASCPS
jgi:hypothetical protein